MLEKNLAIAILPMTRFVPVMTYMAQGGSLVDHYLDWMLSAPTLESCKERIQSHKEKFKTVTHILESIEEITITHKETVE
jgi:hypothetical protein